MHTVKLLWPFSFNEYMLALSEFGLEALFTGWQGQDRLFQCFGTGNQRLFGDCQL